MGTKQKTRKIGRLTLFSIMLLGLAWVFTPEVQAATAGDFKYIKILDEAVITEYKGNASEVVIPDTLGGKPVTEIDEYAFFGNMNLKSVTMPDSVAYLGEGAFAYCDQLNSISLSKGLKSIGAGAFYFCTGLQRMAIPDSVTYIGENAFLYCQSLKSFTVGEDNKKYSSKDGILFDKRKTMLIQCPAQKSGKIKMPDSVTGMGSGAFYGCEKLTNVTLSKNLKSISEGAFISCMKLTKLTIPKSVTSIENNAFTSCVKLNQITVAAGNKKYSSSGGVLYNKNKTELITCPEGKTGKYIIPSSVTKIGNDAFSNCTKLTGVTIPNSVKAIGSSAFFSCFRLTSVTIPGSVSEISEQAFAYCIKLKQVVIKDRVKSIGSSAFMGCIQLQSVTMPASVVRMGYYVFEDCNQVTILGKKGSYSQRYAAKNKINFVVK